MKLKGTIFSLIFLFVGVLSENSFSQSSNGPGKMTEKKIISIENTFLNTIRADSYDVVENPMNDVLKKSDRKAPYNGDIHCKKHVNFQDSNLIYGLTVYSCFKSLNIKKTILNPEDYIGAMVVSLVGELSIKSEAAFSAYFSTIDIQHNRTSYLGSFVSASWGVGLTASAALGANGSIAAIGSYPVSLSAGAGFVFYEFHPKSLLDYLD